MNNANSALREKVESIIPPAPRPPAPLPDASQAEMAAYRREEMVADSHDMRRLVIMDRIFGLVAEREERAFFSGVQMGWRSDLTDRKKRKVLNAAIRGAVEKFADAVLLEIPSPVNNPVAKGEHIAALEQRAKHEAAMSVLFPEEGI